MSTQKTVAVFGGGVAGLTAAHELAARGYKVSVYEANGPDHHAGGEPAHEEPAHEEPAHDEHGHDEHGHGEPVRDAHGHDEPVHDGPAYAFGGKCRSDYWVAPGGTILPGEHGYRFFPAFYECLPDTLKRIPVNAADVDARDALDLGAFAGRSVYERNMSPAEEMALARHGQRLYPIKRELPRIWDLIPLATAAWQAFHTIPNHDRLVVAHHMLHYLTTGPVEREAVYDDISFWEFMGADELSTETKVLLEAAPKSLVAMKASVGSARTIMDAFILMMVDFQKERPSDLVLKGPTTEAWIIPWFNWLEKLGVDFHTGSPLEKLELSDHRVEAGILRGGERIVADHYVLALPIEAAAPVLLASDVSPERHPWLTKVLRLRLEPHLLGSMSGMQAYLRTDAPLISGHIAFPDAPWAVSAISQSQFWHPKHREPLRREGVKTLLSIIFTEWDEPRIPTRPPARSLTKTQILRHLREQIAGSLDRSGRPILYEDDILFWHLDHHLEWDDDGHLVGEPAQLLVHPPGLWKKRPLPADDDMHNLVLASDYVRNPMDLATMEGACSAARLAVNEILERDGGRIVERAYVQHDYQDANDSPRLRRLKAYNDQDFQRAGPSVRPSRHDVRRRGDSGIGDARALLRLQGAFMKKRRR